MTKEQLQQIKDHTRRIVKAPWYWKRSYEMPDGRKHWALTTPESEKKGMILDPRIILMDTTDDYLGEPFLNDNLMFLANAREYIELLIAEIESHAEQCVCS